VNSRCLPGLTQDAKAVKQHGGGVLYGTR